jgi:ketosteroid isomerase-like protein
VLDRRVFIGVGALGVALVGAGLLFWSDDEDEIRELLDRLTRAVAPPASAAANPAFRALDLRGALREIFTSDAKIDAPELAETGPLGVDEVVAASMRYGERYVGSSITLTRMTIEVSKLGDTATSTALAVLEGGGTELGRRDERELRFDLVKIDGEWRIARVIVGARR